MAMGLLNKRDCWGYAWQQPFECQGRPLEGQGSSMDPSRHSRLRGWYSLRQRNVWATDSSSLMGPEPFYRFKSIAWLPLDGHQKQGKERKLQENKKGGHQLTKQLRQTNLCFALGSMGFAVGGWIRMHSTGARTKTKLSHEV